MPNISQILQTTSEILSASGIAEPRREAASLLAFHLDKDKTFLIAYPEFELTGADANQFRKIVARRAKSEPFQYITGNQEFYGLNFAVNQSVLIPRPETELIVETAIEVLRNSDKPRFLEIGVGSGCISVSILHEVEKATAVGVDISAKALQTAKNNAERHGVSDRFELKESDVFAVLGSEKFDLIVSNPPYIPNDDIADLQTEVRDFEPLIALTDGKDGLSIIENIVKNSPYFVEPGGYLILEIGFNQSETVTQMFVDDVWQSVEFFKDLQGIPRTVRAQLK